MTKLSFVLVLTCAAFGCKKGGGGDCAKAIDRGMELSKDMMPKDPAIVQKMKDLGVRHCTDDKWSAEALDCMINAKAMADAQACYGKLTPEQQTKMNKAAMEMQPSNGGSAAVDTTNAGSAAAGSADTGGSAAPK